MYGLTDLFIQAEDDHYSKKIEGKHLTAYMCYGYKIVKDKNTGEVVIVTTTRGGDFYDEATGDEYKKFKDLGWKSALYVLYLSNCRSKLGYLEARINQALVESESVKVIRRLKSSREQTLKNFNKVKSKIKSNEK